MSGQLPSGEGRNEINVNYPTQAKEWLEWGTRAISNFETLKR